MEGEGAMSPLCHLLVHLHTTYLHTWEEEIAYDDDVVWPVVIHSIHSKFQMMNVLIPTPLPFLPTRMRLIQSNLPIYPHPT